jgi:hypothetical protein
MLLGSLQKGSLDMMGAVVELAVGGHPGIEWILRIQNPSMCTPFEVAVPLREQALEWMASIKETAQYASARVSCIMQRCVSFTVLSTGRCRRICSLSVDDYLLNKAPHYEGILGSGCEGPHILNIRTRWRCVVSFMPQPLYLWCKSPSPHWIGGWVGPRACLNMMVKIKSPIISPTRN